MDALALSPRRCPDGASASPRRRLKRDAPLPAPNVDVQWKFLPALRSSQCTSPPSARLFDLFDSPRVRAELAPEQQRLRREQDAAEQEQQRVMLDLLGETQRKAMLDKVMADMEAMAVTPVRHVTERRHSPLQKLTASTRRSSTLPAKVVADVELLPQRRLSALGSDIQNDDDDDDDDPRDCSDDDDPDGGGTSTSDAGDLPELRQLHDRFRRRLNASEACGAGGGDGRSGQQELRVLWQKSAHVRLAQDVPPSLLLGFSDDDMTRQWSACASEERRDPTFSRSATRMSLAIRQALPPSSPPKIIELTTALTPTLGSPVTAALEMSSPRIRRVRKAHYGSWYVPQHQWWQLHQTEQDALAETYPDEVPPPVEHHHCHHHPNERNHKEPVPTSTTVSSDAWPPPPRAGSYKLSTVSAYTATASPSRPPTSGSTLSPLSPPRELHRSSRGSSRGSTASSSSCAHHHHRPSGFGSPTNGAAAADRAASADPIVQRSAVLQQELAQSYIAREYRNYIVSKGERVPSYLSH